MVYAKSWEVARGGLEIGWGGEIRCPRTGLQFVSKGFLFQIFASGADWGFLVVRPTTLMMKTLEEVVLEESGWGTSLNEVKSNIMDLKVILRRVTSRLEGVALAIEQATNHVSHLDV